MKQCSKCKGIKELSEFHKCLPNKDGLTGSCKKCHRDKALKRNRSLSGFIELKYRNQNTSCKSRGHNPPEYTLDEFKEWILSQDKFHVLFEEWVKSDYDRNLSPSVDRLDDYKGYSFDNIQLMTWDENRLKGHRDAMNGINNKRSIIVMQFDLNEVFINEYYSACQASRDTGVHQGTIGMCCRGEQRMAGGFKWKYKDNK